MDEFRVYSRVLTGPEIGVLAQGTPPDTTAPTEPTSLEATTNGQGVDLTWVAGSDGESGVASHRL